MITALTEFRRISNKDFLSNGPADFEHLSDKDLYAYCKKVGYNARIWYRRFIATIPEVAKRRLYKKYGYCSIREFAAKLGGVSRDNVDEVLRVSEKFRELPKMKALIGEIGLSKLRVVACVANKENEKDLAEKVKNFTKSSLEIYVRETLRKNDNENIPATGNGQSVFTLPGEEFAGEQNDRTPQEQARIGLTGNAENINEEVANHQNHDKRTFTIQIDEETEFELRRFKQKVEKERKEPIDWNSALKEMVKRATGEQKVEQKKSRPNVKSATASGPRTKHEIVIPKFRDSLVVKQLESAKQKPVSRYIPAEIRHDLQKKYNGQCAYRGCNKPAEQIHHPVRFAARPNHENLVPLCRAHHDYIHQNCDPDNSFDFFKMKHCSCNARVNEER